MLGSLSDESSELLRVVLDFSTWVAAPESSESSESVISLMLPNRASNWQDVAVFLAESHLSFSSGAVQCEFENLSCSSLAKSSKCLRSWSGLNSP